MNPPLSLPTALGGPMLFPDGPPSWPRPDPEVRAALVRLAEDRSWGHYSGEHVRDLEAELARAFAVASVRTCASGTLALEIALKACGVVAGTEVVLAGYEYDATAHVVLALGAIPVFVDVRPGSHAIDPERIAGALSPNTRAAIVSHLHGSIADVDAVRAKLGDVPIVEDAAQCPGATFDGRPVGSRGDLGILSFGGSKLLSAGRGGAVLATDPKLAQKVKVLLQRGVQQIAPLSEMQAAILLPQLRRLPSDNARREANVRRLADRLAGLPGIAIPSAEHLRSSGDRPSWYKLGMRLDAGAFGVSRDRLVEVLRAEGIAADAGFRPGHVGRSPSRFRAGSVLVESEAAGLDTLILHHPILSGSESDAAKVAEGFERAYLYRYRLRE